MMEIQMNRKQIIEHFRGLAEIMGKNIKTEPTGNGHRVICDGKSIVLPPRNRKIRRIGLLENQLGLRNLNFS